MDILCSVSGAQRSTGGCLDCARGTGRPPCGFDYALLNALYASSEQEARAHEIHVTDLTGCGLKAFWDKTAPNPEYPHEMLVRWIGTGVHAQVEGAAASSDQYLDSELAVNVDGIVGRSDIVYKDGRLVDIKTTRWMKVEKLPYGSHILQVNLYAWMLRQQGREINRLQIQYIDTSGPSKCRACSQTVRVMDGLLRCPKCGKEVKGAHLGAYLLDVPLMTDPEIMSMVMARKESLQAALEMGFPPQREPNYLCSYCSHYTRCQPDLAD